MVAGRHGVVPQPLVWTLVAIGLTIYSARKYVSTKRKAAQLKLGRDGERAVAQYLEVHREPGWRLLNDIPAGRFNVDHVLIAPQGVFVLETKTRSKPAKGNAEVTYNGQRVLVDGFAPDRDPIVRARAIRDWVRDTLRETTGRSIGVKGVVVYPEWYVRQSEDWWKPEVWVLNEKALPKLLIHQPIVLKDEDIALIATALTLHVRSASL